MVVLVQALSGETEIVSTRSSQLTEFQSAYLLFGRYWGDWRLAGRFDVFGTQNPSEHGLAGTGSVSWTPKHWLRLAAEILQVHSYRAARSQENLPQVSDETQLQVVGRLFF